MEESLIEVEVEEEYMGGGEMNGGMGGGYDAILIFLHRPIINRLRLRNNLQTL